MLPLHKAGKYPSACGLDVLSVARRHKATALCCVAHLGSPTIGLHQIHFFRVHVVHPPMSLFQAATYSNMDIVCLCPHVAQQSISRSHPFSHRKPRRPESQPTLLSPPISSCSPVVLLSLTIASDVPVLPRPRRHASTFQGTA
jgi:hypothetical protein